jgi:hypothetical protein
MPGKFEPMTIAKVSKLFCVNGVIGPKSFSLTVVNDYTRKKVYMCVYLKYCC